MNKEQIIKMLKEHNIDPNKYDIDQLAMGYQIELEHGSKYGDDTNVTNDDPWKTIQISLSHIIEISDYYTRLAKMEKDAKSEKVNENKIIVKMRLK